MTNLYRITYTHTGEAGAPYYSTFHVLAEYGNPQGHVDALDAFWSSWATYRVSALTTKADDAAVLFDDTTGEALNVVAVEGATIVGSSSATALPRASQGMVTWDTQAYNGGRRIRGRSFLPGLTINSVSAGGVLTTSVKDAIQAGANTLVGGPTTILVVWSRPTPARTGSSRSVLAASVASEFAVLTSRRD